MHVKDFKSFSEGISQMVLLVQEKYSLSEKRNRKLKQTTFVHKERRKTVKPLSDQKEIACLSITCNVCSCKVIPIESIQIS